MKNALREKGIICCQGETHWNFSELISKIVSFAGNIFPTVSYGINSKLFSFFECSILFFNIFLKAQTQIPSYPTGCIGFILCSLEAVTN
jgi:spermidine synthase